MGYYGSPGMRLLALAMLIMAAITPVNIALAGTSVQRTFVVFIIASPEICVSNRVYVLHLAKEFHARGARVVLAAYVPKGGTPPPSLYYMYARNRNVFSSLVVLTRDSKVIRDLGIGGEQWASTDFAIALYTPEGRLVDGGFIWSIRLARLLAFLHEHSPAQGAANHSTTVGEPTPGDSGGGGSSNPGPTPAYPTALSPYLPV